MRILVNLVGILKEDSQSLYARSMLMELTREKASPHFFVVVASKNIAWPKTLRATNVEVITIGFAKGTTLSFLALQLVVPFIFLIKKCKTVYSPTTLFPWLLVKRSIVTIHDLAYSKFPEEAGFLSRKLVSFSYRLASNYAEHIVAISNTTANAIRSLYKRNETMTVIYNAPIVESESRASIICPTLPRSYILYVGINRPRKNLVTLIKALEYISGVQLVIAGDRITGTHLMNVATASGVEDRIIELGYISSEECKKQLYTNAMLFAFPTLDEGFGLPVVEAQLLGTPLVVSDIPIMHEVAGSGALFADPRDPKGFAHAINQVLSDAEVRESLRSKGLANTKRFSWVVSAKALTQIFNSVR